MEINTPMEFRKALLKFAFQELTEPVRNPALEYLKSKNNDTYRNTMMSAIVANMSSNKTTAVKGQTVVVGLKDQQSYPKKYYTSGTDYEYLLATGDEDFKAIFQMSRRTVNKIVRLIEKRIAVPEKGDIKLIPIKKRVYLTVWMLANRESVETTAAIFGVLENDVSKIFLHTCKEISLFSNKYIHWPSAQDRGNITKSFKSTYGFPGVVGVIGSVPLDVTLPIVTPAEEFWNLQMETQRIILQIVVDDKMLIRNAYVDSSQGASCVNAFQMSSIHSWILNNSTNPVFGMNEHLLGNPVFPQLTNLLTPYAHETNNRPITDEEEEYNEIHSNTCSVVEQTLKTLKARFEQLHFLGICSVELATKVVFALCVLHNFTLLHGDVS